jgi:hypothetical protein
MKSAGHNKGRKVNSSFIRIGQLQPPTNKRPNWISQISKKKRKKWLILQVIIGLYNMDLNIYNFRPKHTSIWWIFKEYKAIIFFLYSGVRNL